MFFYKVEKLDGFGVISEFLKLMDFQLQTSKL